MDNFQGILCIVVLSRKCRSCKAAGRTGQESKSKSKSKAGGLGRFIALDCITAILGNEAPAPAYLHSKEGTKTLAHLRQVL